MKNYRITVLAAFALCALSCTHKASITGVVPAAPKDTLSIEKLTTSGSKVVCEVVTDASGKFTTKLDIKKGDPEFIYVYRDNRKLSSLLVSEGDNIRFEADTLGNWTVEGSEDCELVRQSEVKFNEFVLDFVASASSAQASKLYVDYYRSCIKFVMENQYSLAVIPVLYQHLNEQTPVFSQATDALYYRRAADSLATVYPDSKYVAALSREASRLENELSLKIKIAGAAVAGFPELSLPGMDGSNVSLSGVDAKVILLHFWDVNSVEARLFNSEVLLPIYDKYHAKGLQIYSVGITYDKSRWGSVVSAQNLPWINVCDGLGVESNALGLYNVQELPTTILIANKEISSETIDGEASLRAAIEKLLR